MLFLRVCQVFGMYLPCSAKVEQLPSLQGHWWEMSLFLGVCTALGNLQPGATSACLSSPSGTLILGLPDHFYIILCPILATTQRKDSFRAWWYCISLTIKWRSIFLWLFSLAFHGRPNNLFAVATFNGGSSYHVWGICHIFQESK